MEQAGEIAFNTRGPNGKLEDNYAGLVLGDGFKRHGRKPRPPRRRHCSEGRKLRLVGDMQHRSDKVKRNSHNQHNNNNSKQRVWLWTPFITTTGTSGDSPGHTISPFLCPPMMVGHNRHLRWHLRSRDIQG